MSDFNKSQADKAADFLFGDDGDVAQNNLDDNAIKNEPVAESEEVLEDVSDLETVEDSSKVELPVEEEQKAKKHGYLSKDEYVAKFGSLDGFKSPEQFNKYGEAWGEVADVIKGIKSKLDERDKQIDSLVKYNERIEAKALQQARQSLEMQLQQAKEMNDIQAVEQLAEQKVKMDIQAVQDVLSKVEQDRIRVESDFITRNKHWFGVNPIMTDRARQLDVLYKVQAQQTGQYLNYEQLASQIENQLKLEFPDMMVKNSAGNSAPVISTSISNINKSSVVDNNSNVDTIFNKLSQEDKDIYNVFNMSLKRQGKPTYSKKEYIQRLKKFGEI